MDRGHVDIVIVERGQPLLLLLRGPLRLRGGDIIIRLRRPGLKRAGRVHRRETRGSQILGRFSHLRPHRGGQPDDMMVYQELTDQFEIAGGVRNQPFGGGVVLLDGAVNLERRFAGIDHPGSFTEDLIFTRQIPHPDRQDFIRGQTHHLAAFQELRVFVATQGERIIGLGQPLPLEPVHISPQFPNGLLICAIELRHERFISHVHERGHKVLAEKIGSPARHLHRRLHFGAGQHRIQIRAGSRKNPGRLLKNRDDGADPVVQRREVPLDVNIDVQHPGIGHRVMGVNTRLFEPEDIPLDRTAKDAEIIKPAGAEAICFHGRQPLIESPQSL